jgi:hypothetical protein
MLGRSLRLGASTVRVVSAGKTQVLPSLTVLSRNVISIQEAKQMKKRYNELQNDTLLTLAMMGDQEAREERMIREIMAVDSISW